MINNFQLFKITFDVFIPFKSNHDTNELYSMQHLYDREMLICPKMLNKIDCIWIIVCTGANLNQYMILIFACTYTDINVMHHEFAYVTSRTKQNLKGTWRHVNALMILCSLPRRLKKPIQYWSPTRLTPADASAITPVFPVDRNER